MDPTNDTALVGKDKEKYRGNVDVYVGGAEHITRHMIYGRFRQKFLYDIDAITQDEPFQEYHSVGLIMGEDGRKMSKRRGNVVNPDDIINEHGTDVLRAYEMFMGPFEQSIARSTNGIKGVKKFLEKIIALKDKINDKEESQETKIILNQTIKKLTEDIDAFRFNTAVSTLMILVNHLTDS
jgi:leucyl-tRNA synthetase